MAHRLSRILLVGLSLGFAACGGDSLTIPPTTGILEVTTTTAGSDVDPDGYTLQVDAAQPQTIGTAATVQIAELTPGAHNVVLTGLASNCSVAGDNPRTVNITVGETTTATFELTCGSTTGGLQVVTQTTGEALDADGYSISLDGTDRGPIGANTTVALSNLTPGSHVVGLSGVAGNCQVSGDNLRAVTITSGAAQTVTFAVTCSALPPTVGSIQITTTTTGQDLDPDGYAFAVDGSQPQPIARAGVQTVANLPVGSHTVALSGVAGNCSVDDASQNVTVTAGGTAIVAFHVTCGLTTGSIRVTTSTTGDTPDDSYQFTIDGGSPQTIPANGIQTVGTIATGSRTVVLSDVASNCDVSGSSSKNVTVTAGQIADVGFSITCTATGPSASKSKVSANPDNFAAGVGSSTITVTVKDAKDHPLSGVTVVPTSSGTGNTVTPTSGTTDENGVATFTFSSPVAEKKTITVTAGGVTLDDTPVITVFKANSTTTITGDAQDPSAPGETIHVTFTVTGEGGDTPTGTVEIFSQEEPLVGCTVAVDVGFCDLVLNTPTTQHLQANYSGDAQFDTSFDTEDHLVQVVVSNQAPVANDDPSAGSEAFYTTPAGTPLTVAAAEGVLKNDTDPDPGTTLTAMTSTSTTTNGGTVSLQTDGGFTYSPPPPPFSGTDTFTYEASDGSLASLPATVTITVQP